MLHTKVPRELFILGNSEIEIRPKFMYSDGQSKFIFYPGEVLVIQ